MIKIETEVDKKLLRVTLNSVISDDPYRIDWAFQRTNALGSGGLAALSRLLLGESLEETRDLLKEGIEFLERVQRDIRLYLERVDEIPPGERFYPHNHYDPKEVIHDYWKYAFKGKGLGMAKAAEILRSKAQSLLGSFRNVLTGTCLSESDLKDMVDTFTDLSAPYVRLGEQAHSKAMRLAGPPF